MNNRQIGGKMLDNPEIYREIDPGDMAGLLTAFPTQLPEGRKIAISVDLSGIDSSKVTNIVVCGMGGSAIGGDLVRAYTIDRLGTPIHINRDYNLPSFVGKNSLVIGSSYSGNTEETLFCFNEAGVRGAQRIAITTGGKLAEIAEGNGIPLIKLPPGLPPRAALGYSFSPILTIFEALGFIPNQDYALNETVESLIAGAESYGLNRPTERNEAKKLANKLQGKLPLIYSDDWHFNTVAVRFRGQINENSKQLAYSAVLPENNHNELVGWKNLGAPADRFIAIYLTDKDIHPKVRFRMELFGETQSGLGVETVWLNSNGESLLARMFSLIQLGDWTSYYLAILNREDPKPVKAIDKLKAALEKFEGK
ncbi:bifunctional phosphoglucose/phosphomannose isomerase [bacterium]|nr:MAG: bifunctional phosphoglucose/phosphomannose isomerase [bacterium]